jgi:alpha-tubulin suppressor-like RCC1 family protein
MKSKVWCWGNGTGGQLGNGVSGANYYSAYPVPILNDVGGEGSEDWLSIAVGLNATCGVREGGTGWCWGTNGNGQMGIGSVVPASQTLPIRVGTVGTGTQFTDWEKIVPANTHVCGVRTNGEAWCWGSRQGGMLGDGGATTGNQLTPVQVGTVGSSTRFSDWIQVAPGLQHTCGVRANGEAWCWGDGMFGGLGRNSSTSSNIPVRVGTAGTATLFADWSKVAVGSRNACGIRNGGEMWCWGNNSYGALGNDTVGGSLVPVRVGTVGTGTLFSDWVDITRVGTGGSTVCGLRADDSAWCWGWGGSGDIGNGLRTTSQLVPSPVLGGPYDAISGTCARKTNGALSCWGTGLYDPPLANLGAGDLQSIGDESTVPVSVTGDHRWQKIVVGGGNYYDYEQVVCGIDQSGQAWCWGDNFHQGGSTARGKLGSGDAANPNFSPTPLAVTGGHSFIDIASTRNVVCALRDDNVTLCWGNGQPATPAVLPGGNLFVAITGGGSSSFCGIRADGAAFCWTGSTGTPTAVNGGIQFTKVSRGYFHACGIDVNDDAYCWGTDGYERLGNGPLGATVDPGLVAGGHKWSAISAGAFHSCGIRVDGVGMCWGTYSGEEIGAGTGFLGTDVPVPVDSADRFLSIDAAEIEYSCGINRQGKAFCWGGGYYGNLGGGDYDTQYSPTAVASKRSFVSISTGDGTTCAVDTDGRGWCWGFNGTGQLGTGYVNDAPSPVPFSCGNPNGNEGQVYYSSVDKIMVFCDGLSWVKMGR